MEVQFRREMNHTYMILETTDQTILESYETKILLNNRIPGLLPCSLQYLDNKTCFCYDVTSRQSLKNQLEGRSLNERELRKLLGNILSAMSHLEDYLLSFSHLVLLPDQVFVAPDSMSVSLCFAPFHEEDIKDGLLRVTDFLLAHTGSNSQEAVILGSRFAHVLRQPNIRMTDLERALYGSLPGAENEVPPSSSPPGPSAFGYPTAGRQESRLPDSENANMAGGRSFFGRSGGRSSAEAGDRSSFGRSGGRSSAEAGDRSSFGRSGGRSSAEAGDRSFSGRSGGRSSAEAGDRSGGRRQKGSSQKPRINGYILVVVAAGAVLAGEVYAFLHYYNRKLPPLPVTAAGAALAAVAAAAVILAARKALRESPENAGDRGDEDAVMGLDCISPYQAAYGGALCGADGMPGLAPERSFFSSSGRERAFNYAAQDPAQSGSSAALGAAGAVGSAGYGPQALAQPGSSAAFGAAGAVGSAGYGPQGSAQPGSSAAFGAAGAVGSAGYGPQALAQPGSSAALGAADCYRSVGAAGEPGPSGSSAGTAENAEIGVTTLLSQAEECRARAYLVPENSAGHASRILLEGKQIRIGKLSGSVDICLGSQAVSRLHAEIVCRGDDFYIRDLNSLNGTAVNDEVLAGNDERVLREGDRLRLADRHFIFHIDESAHK